MIYFMIAIFVALIVVLISNRKNAYSLVPSAAFIIFVEICMFYINYLSKYVDNMYIERLAFLNEGLFIIILPLFNMAVLFVYAFAILDGEKWTKSHIVSLILAILLLVAICTKLILYIYPFSRIVDIAIQIFLYISNFISTMTNSYLLATERYRYYRNHKTLNKYDCIIVLGYRLEGKHSSKVLRDRIEMAYKYWCRHGENLPIYLCGGKCFANLLPEAEVMEEEFRELGVYPELLHKESKSSNTKENFKNIAFKLMENGVENPRCLIVTNYFHMFRSVTVAKEADMNADAIGSRENIIDPLYLKLMSRELMAFVFKHPYLFIIYTETILLILSFAYITFTI